MANKNSISMAVASLDAPLDYYDRYAIPLSEFMAKADASELDYVFLCIKSVQEHPLWEGSSNPDQLRQQPYIALSLTEDKGESFYMIVKCENNGNTFLVGYESIISDIGLPNEMIKVEA